MEEAYDSAPDTLKHIARVNQLLCRAAEELQRRGKIHDASKLLSPEKEAFDIMTPRLKFLVYGSPEYKASLDEMRPAIDHHQKNNSHHPEFYPQGELNDEEKEIKEFLELYEDPEIYTYGGASLEARFVLEKYIKDRESSVNGMDLFDLIEMFFDWKAAGERSESGGSILKSIQLNEERFRINSQISSIFKNTAERYRDLLSKDPS